MADVKSIVKMNKMIHKKTRASFLVVYVIYVSLVYTDSKKTTSCLLPRHTIFATFGRQILMPTCTHTERFISIPLDSGQSELASICLFVQFTLLFIIQRTLLLPSIEHEAETLDFSTHALPRNL